MGRLEVSAPLSGGGGGASQSSFRELDDVFLQTQTRIWLGEVLKMRLDEQIHISDLLADGDLLCEVSKVLWNMLSAKYAELRHLKYKPIGSRKRSGRYMPYSNVDSFLAICKILGLNGIDLFSPSDVVEKRNTRKVCICIRALSKKVRSKQLNVPNFDMVTYAVAMPKDMVGGIRRSLETSKSSISSSSSYNLYNYQRPTVRQRNLTEACDRNYDSCSEGSDEAESKYMGEESYCSSTNKFDDSAAVNSDCENIPGAHSGTGGTICCTQDDYESSINQHHSESSESPVSQCARNDHPPDSISYSHVHSQRKSLQRTLRQNDDVKGILDNNLMHLDRIDLSLGHEESTGDSAYDNEAEGNYISDYLAFSDSIIGGHEGNTPVLLDGEDNMLNFFSGIDSFRGRSGQALQDGHEKKISDDIDDVEVSSTASVSSILDRALNLEFDDHFDVVGSLIVDTHTVLLAEKGEGCLSNSQNEQIGSQGLSSQGANKPPVILENSSIDQSSVVPVNSFDTNQAMEEKCSCSALNGSNDASILQSSEIPNECDAKDMDENLLAENASDGKDGTIAGLSKDKCDTKDMDEAENAEDGTIAGLSKDKVRQRPFLKTVKTVASGTAIVGLLFLLLHLSRRERGKSSDASRKLVQNKKFKGRDISNKEGQSGATARIYPAEKLKFKN